jgi:hypothetical protein
VWLAARFRRGTFIAARTCNLARVNPDGGQLGAATTEPEPKEGAVVEEGASKISSIPTS